MNPNKFETDFASIPNCTAEQYADARAYLLKHAPDLLAVVLGGAA